MSAPLVAVVMPVYNQEKFVGPAIQSVLAQTYPHWHLSMCDDYSNDGTSVITRPYLQVNAGRIDCIFHHKNLGLPSARNSAYARAPREAEFVVFLDSDDLLAPDALETMLARFEVATLAGFVCGDKADIGACGCPAKPKYYAPPLTPGRLYTFDDWLGSDMGVFPPSRMMFRRWIVDAAGGWNVSIDAVEDHDFYLRCALHGPMVYTPGIVTSYRNHAGNHTDDREAMAASWPLRSQLQDSYRAAWAARGKQY